MEYNLNKRLKILLIACLSMCFNVHNLFAQEIWENMVEQLVVQNEDDTYRWENLMEELSELK